MEIELSSHFLKRAKKLSENDQQKLSERTDWFRNNSQDPRLKIHPLTGKLKGLYSFSISYGKRVIYMIVKKDTALFIDVGSHDEVYR